MDVLTTESNHFAQKCFSNEIYQLIVGFQKDKVKECGKPNIHSWGEPVSVCQSRLFPYPMSQHKDSCVYVATPCHNRANAIGRTPSTKHSESTNES